VRISLISGLVRDCSPEKESGLVILLGQIVGVFKSLCEFLLETCVLTGMIARVLVSDGLTVRHN